MKEAAEKSAQDKIAAECKLKAAEKKAEADIISAKKQGRDEGIEEVSLHLAGCTDSSAAKRIDKRCEKAKAAESQKLKKTISRLEKSMARRPSEDLQNRLDSLRMKEASVGSPLTVLMRRESIRRRVSRNRWIISIVIISMLLLVSSSFWIRNHNKAGSYRNILVSLATEGLHTGGSVTQETWNTVLSVYNDVFGTDYVAGR